MTELAGRPKYPVQTLEKALDVIEILKDGPSQGLRIKDLSEKLEMGKSTVHRLLDTLAAYQYVEKTEGNRYRLSWKFFEVGSIVPQQRNLASIDPGILQNLSIKYNETVNLGIRASNHLVIVSRADPPQVAIKAALGVGEREPLHATALGKVLICELNVRELFGDQPLEAYTSHTITSIDVLEQHLETVRTQGYAIDDEEYSPGLLCIAMPVRNYKGEIVAGLSISGPAFRLNYNKVLTMKEDLQVACEQLSQHFGAGTVTKAGEK